MSSLVNPITFRLGFVKYWNNNWCCSTKINYSFLNQQDYYIYKYIENYLLNKKLLFNEYILDNIKIIRSNNNLNIYIYIKNQKFCLFLFKHYNWFNIFENTNINLSNQPEGDESLLKKKLKLISFLINIRKLQNLNSYITLMLKNNVIVFSTAFNNMELYFNKRFNFCTYIKFYNKIYTHYQKLEKNQPQHSVIKSKQNLEVKKFYKIEEVGQCKNQHSQLKTVDKQITEKSEQINIKLKLEANHGMGEHVGFEALLQRIRDSYSTNAIIEETQEEDPNVQYIDVEKIRIITDPKDIDENKKIRYVNPRLKNFRIVKNLNENPEDIQYVDIKNLKLIRNVSSEKKNQYSKWESNQREIKEQRIEKKRKLKKFLIKYFFIIFSFISYKYLYFWWKVLLRSKLKKLLKNNSLIINIYFIVFWLNYFSAFFLGQFIKYKLLLNYPLGYILYNLGKLLNRARFRKIIFGFKILFSGRFTRKDRKTHKWISKGWLSYGTMHSNLDYHLTILPLLNSLCGIKIWLNKKASYKFVNIF